MLAYRELLLTRGNTFQWNTNQNKTFFIQENTREIVVC